MFSITICRPTGDKWQSKTLFLTIFDLHSSIALTFSIPPIRCDNGTYTVIRSDDDFPSGIRIKDIRQVVKEYKMREDIIAIATGQNHEQQQRHNIFRCHALK